MRSVINKLNLEIIVDIFNKSNYYIVLKRLISILLVMMLVFNSAGYVFVFYQLKKYFKKEAFSKLENYINPDDLSTIVVSKYQYENEDDNFYFVEPHEIKFYGKMYDIARTDFTDDSVKITALNDENEDNLHELFAQFFSRTMNDKYSHYASVLSLIIIDSGLPAQFDDVARFKEYSYFNITLIHILKTFFDVPTPPPKILV